MKATMSAPTIPACRFGRRYDSLTVSEITTAGGDEVVARVGLVNPGLIRRDLRRITDCFDRLQQIPVQKMLDICAEAAGHFMEAELPVSDDLTQTPDDYVRVLSATCGLPHALIRANMAKVADVLSNMTEGAISLTNSRWEFEAGWEVGWQRVDTTEWEGLVTVDYHVNRFTSFFAGSDFIGEDSSSEETRGVLGIRYLLPLNLETAAWLDTDGGARFMLEREFELTPRIDLHGEVEYDTHEQWEGKVSLSYLINKEFSILANWHSEFGIGAGLQLRF